MSNLEDRVKTNINVLNSQIRAAKQKIIESEKELCYQRGWLNGLELALQNTTKDFKEFYNEDHSTTKT